MALYKGCAPIGAYGTPGGFYLYCVDHFGYDESLGYFSASFTLYEARPPMTPDQAEAALAERCGHLMEDLDAATKVDLCEQYDCAPSALAESYFDELMRDNGGDPFAAYAAEFEARPFDEGDVALLIAAGGQRDAFDAVQYYFLDSSLVDGIKALWEGWCLKPEVPADVMDQIDAIVDALSRSITPEQAAAVYAESHPGCFRSAG